MRIARRSKLLETRRFSILLIDLDAAYAESVDAALQACADRELRLSSVVQLADAGSACAERHYDAALIDMSRVGRDDLTTVRRLAAQSPNMAVVACGAAPDHAIERAVLAAGVESFVSKDACSVDVMARLLLHAAERRALQSTLNRQARELKRVNGQFETMVEEHGDAILVVGGDGAVQYVNLAAEDLFGRPASDLVGAEIGVPLGAGREVEMAIVRPDGREITADMRVMPAMWNGVACHMASLRDVTERKTLEESLQNEAANAQAAAEAKSAFLANMSHELRTPLNCILGYVDLIRNEIYGPLSNEKYREYLDIAVSSGQDLLEMISDILELSKSDADKIQLHESEFNFDVLARECLKEMSPIVRKARLNAYSQIPKTQILGDEKRLKQVILNLLSNAAKFTKPGGVIELSSTILDSGDLEVQVRDTGIGIPKDEQAKIFNSFEQATSASGSAQQGTGLGLAICKRFVELHGGRISVKSVPGIGTTFSLTIPEERLVKADVLEHPNAQDVRLRRMWG